MRAIGYTTAGPITADSALVDIYLPEPTPGDRDLLVEVKAVSVNPVDTKVRRAVSPDEGAHKVLGWDAAGIVRAVGAGVTHYAPGDAVYYAGSIARPLHQTPDMGEQKVLLDEVARLIDAGAVRTTLTERLSRMDARTLTKAHAQVESGTMRGKVVVEGWPG